MATRYTYSCYITLGQPLNFSGSQLILLPTGVTDTISLLHRLVGRFKHVIYEKHFINYKELSYLLLLNKVKKTAIKRVGIDSKKINWYLLSESGMGFERPQISCLSCVLPNIKMCQPVLEGRECGMKWKQECSGLEVKGRQSETLEMAQQKDLFIVHTLRW